MIPPLGLLATQAGLAPADVVTERTGQVATKGLPLTLLGDEVKVGHKAPNFTVVDQDFKPVSLYDYKGKTVLLSAVPSLDTQPCRNQTKRFEAEAARLPGVQMLTISEDLPFAQRRFCEAEAIARVKVCSDAVHREFGMKYGLLVKDRGFLARAVILVDASGLVAYQQLVPELGQQPDYEPVLARLRAAAQ